MNAGAGVERHVAVLLLSLVVPVSASAQSGSGPVQSPPLTQLSMAEAVRLALERNQSLRAQRLNVDESRADEITAALKPNFNVSAGADGFSVFSPRQLGFGNLADTLTFTGSLGYTFERGGKRQKRIALAQDTTDVTAKTVMDGERQLRFSTEQEFINVLLARSTLDLAQQNLKNFADLVEVNRQRVTAGDLSQGDFVKISLQKLQFEQDVSAAEIGLVQAKAALRQLIGFEAVADDFDVAGDLTHTRHAIALDDLKREALTSRADLRAAESGVTLARDAVALAIGNRARDVDGGLNYEKTGPSNTMGVGVSFALPFRDRNQGNIARSEIAVRQAAEAAAAARFTVLTDVTSAYAAYQTNDKVVALFESGYLDQARESLDITTFAYQRGAASLLDLLEAERTARDTQMAYRQALAAYMTSIQQLNFVVGRQVIQ